MRVQSISFAFLSALGLGACTASVPPPTVAFTGPQQSSECSTASARIFLDFDGASRSRCAIEGERAFSLLVTPEHAPPINPSPWYAFRYDAADGGDVIVRLRYVGGKHRYAPLLTVGSESRTLPVDISEDGETAELRLPVGTGVVSAQEMLDGEHYRTAIARWAQTTGSTPFALGQSHGGRPINAILLGNSSAERLVVLLGRQHPPEVTGAIAMEAFVDRLAERIASNPDISDRYQFLVVPLLNPDGVARGHWRANLGGRDLNRDWGNFTQPETQAVKRWLDGLPPGVRPVLMLDFHSTFRNLFYVQGEEAGSRGEAFLIQWLAGKEDAFPGFPFTLERRNANPGSGTTKNWFNEVYGIPAYTYEIADDADRAATRSAAAALAEALPEALDAVAE